MTRWLTLVWLLGILTSPAFGQAPRTLDKLKAAHTITLGYREASYPFSYRASDGSPAGYSVDLCTRVVAGLQEQLGLSALRAQWTLVTPETRLAMVADGAIDLECGSTSNTLSRQEQVDFSHMTFVDGGSLLVSSAAQIARLSDLAGKRVAVIPGTTTEQVMADVLQKAGVTVQMVPVKEHTEGLVALENGRVDGYASDRVLLIGLALRAKDPTRLALADQYFSYEPYGLVLRRGDADFRLAVNRVLSRVYRSGDIVPLYERWFGPFARASDLLKAMYLLHSLPE